LGREAEAKRENSCPIWTDQGPATQRLKEKQEFSGADNGFGGGGKNPVYNFWSELFLGAGLPPTNVPATEGWGSASGGRKGKKQKVRSKGKGKKEAQVSYSQIRTNKEICCAPPSRMRTLIQVDWGQGNTDTVEGF